MTNQTPPTLPRHKPHTATYGDFLNIVRTAPNLRQKLMKELAAKTEKEMLQVFAIRREIYNRIKTNTREQINFMEKVKAEHPHQYDYCITLIAIQLHDADAKKSEYIAEVREARQDPPSFQTSPLKEVVRSIMPLIDNLKDKGATWQELTKMVNAKKRKILSGRKISVEYLKKTYYKIKKESQ